MAFTGRGRRRGPLHLLLTSFLCAGKPNDLLCCMLQDQHMKDKQCKNKNGSTQRGWVPATQAQSEDGPPN